MANNTDITGNLKYEDGFQKVTVNEDFNRVISWNPNDANFVDRFLAFQSRVETDFKPKMQALKLGKDNDLSDYEVGTISELGKEMCDAIDETFLSPVSKAAFNGVNPLSPMSNGSYLFMNFMNALMPLIQKSIGDFEEARKKYTYAGKKIQTSKKS